MAHGNGTNGTHPPTREREMPESFYDKQRVKVEAPDLGREVYVIEAEVGPLWETVIGGNVDTQEFTKRVICASVEIDGYMIPPDRWNDLSMKKVGTLQKLMPPILAINGLSSRRNLLDLVREAGEALARGNVEASEPADAPEPLADTSPQPPEEQPAKGRRGSAQETQP